MVEDESQAQHSVMHSIHSVMHSIHSRHHPRLKIAGAHNRTPAEPPHKIQQTIGGKRKRKRKRAKNTQSSRNRMGNERYTL